MCPCVLLVYSTKESRDQTSPVIKEFLVKNDEAYGITKGANDQSSFEVTDNISYSTVGTTIITDYSSSF